MAIMEMDTSEVSGGFDKKLDSGAIDMLLDNFQSSQYAYPIKSTIREVVSNAIDSVKEKHIALEILNGTALVSDYYEERDGPLFKDSKFDHNYYNKEWLDVDNKKVIIEYRVGEGMEKDKIVITDCGVGLGSYRLEKYFDIGYSTKRLSKAPLGKFGIGAKSPLSINPFYTMESAYNGRLYRFNVYASKVESIIGKFDLESGTENQKQVLGNGYELYYESTTRKNGVSIFIDAKKHYKQEVEEAVKSQLLYFDDVEFRINDVVIPFKAPILYEDDLIILSDSKYYSKPHILLNKVNYGYIDFNELELEEKVGNIGIKVLPEDVKVSPSRERLIWGDETKECILKRFNQVTGIAERLVQQELQETDFLRWISLCYNISSKYNRENQNGSVIERLALLVDMSSIKPVFNGTNIRFSPILFQELQMRKVEYSTKRMHSKTITKINRKEIHSLMDIARGLPVILTDEAANNRKDKYLLSLYSEFIFIHKPLSIPNLGDETIDKYNNEKQLLYDLLAASKDVIFYDKVVVPEDFKGTNEEEDVEEEVKEDVEQVRLSAMSQAERRKLEGKITLTTPYRTDYAKTIWHRLEVKTADIDNWEEEEIFWGNDADADTLKTIVDITALTNDRSVRSEDSSTWCKKNSYGYEYYLTHFIDNPLIKIVKVSQQNSKYFRDFKHANNFFYQINKGVLTMSNALIRWNTARLIANKLHQVNFLYNFSLEPKRRDSYRKLLTFCMSYYRNTAPEATSTLIEHLDKVYLFQKFVAQDGVSSEDISKLALEMWKTEKITDAHAVDPELIAELEELIDWARPIAPLLNSIGTLNGELPYTIDDNTFEARTDLPIPEELEHAIRNYMDMKSVS